MTARVRRCAVVSALLLVGCADDGGAAGEGSASEAGSETGPSGTTAAETSGTTTASSTGGTSTATDEGGTDGGSAGSTSTATGDGGSTGGDFEPIDPTRLEWEVLPEIVGGPSERVEQAALSLDPSGEIIVSAISVFPTFSAPWEVNAYRLDGDSWTVLGDGPAVSVDAEQKISGTSMVALEDEVLVIYRVEVEERLSILEGGAWTEPTIDPAAVDGFDPYEVAVDDEGRPLVLAVVDGVARVYRRDGGTWAQLGGNLEASAIPFPGLGTLVTGPGGRVAASAGGAVHLFDGAQWLNLGAFSSGAVLTNTRFAFNSDGALLVPWSQDGGLYVAYWDPDASEFVPLAGDLGFEATAATPELALDAADTPFATWRETMTVYVARLVDDVWTPYIGDGIPGGAGSTGVRPEIRLNTLGLPVVIWEATAPGLGSHVGAARAVLR